MININFVEPDHQKWKQWRRKCEQAQRELNESYARGEPKAILDKLYKGQKEFYVGLHGLFHGKCAYCETSIAVSQPGDIDHFRPKRRVTQSAQPVMIPDRSAQNAFHPGYYWLAYECRNLLPTCEDCNRPNKSKTRGHRIGKWNEFPVKNFRAYAPGGEIHEEPLLLNPIAELDVSEHLRIDERGVFACLTAEGHTTCEIFGLNLREALIQERIEAYKKGRDAVTFLLLARVDNNVKRIKDCENIIKNFQDGVSPYSVAGRAGIKEGENVLKDTLEQILKFTSI